MNRKKQLALTGACLAVASTAAVVDAALEPAAADHSDYCGHGIGPESYHDGIRYRARFISHRSTVGPHIHKYQQQRFWNLAWYPQHTFEKACPT